MQQLATPLLPAVMPYLAESLYLDVPQATVEYLHLVESFSQHTVRSASLHVPAAHNKSLALAFNLSPAAQLPVEHFALFEQHAVFGSAGLTLFFAVSLNLLLPHVTAVLTHWVLSGSQ
jgi:hypothetical protein